MINSTRHFQNDSALDYREDKEEETILGFSAEFDTFPLVLAIFIAALNSFILFLAIRLPSLRKVTNIILVSLAFSDFLSGVLGIPFYLACSAIQLTPVCGITQVLTRFFSISIVLHLLLVSIDRHVAVVHAIRYRSLVTKRRALFWLILVWMIATFASLIQLSWVGLEVDVNDDFEEKTARTSNIYNIFCIVVFFAVPLFTMIFCYVTIFLALRQQLRAIRQNNVGPSFKEVKRRSRARERRAALTFVVMIIIYIFCWFPYFLLDFQHQLGNEFFTLPIVVEYTVFYYPKFFNSLLNPLLYVFCKHDFRQAMYTMIGRAPMDEGRSFSLQNTYGKGSHRT